MAPRKLAGPQPGRLASCDAFPAFLAGHEDAWVAVTAEIANRSDDSSLAAFRWASRCTCSRTCAEDPRSTAVGRTVSMFFTARHLHGAAVADRLSGDESVQPPLAVELPGSGSVLKEIPQAAGTTLVPCHEQRRRCTAVSSGVVRVGLDHGPRTGIRPTPCRSGCATAADLVDHYPRASVAVVEDAGHALPHEQPNLLRALVAEWPAGVERPG